MHERVSRGGGNGSRGFGGRVDLYLWFTAYGYSPTRTHREAGEGIRIALGMGIGEGGVRGW